MEIDFWMLLFVFLPAIGGGIIQTTTGFGSGIFVMLFFPLFLPMLQSSALSTLITVWLCLLIAWRYRQYIDPKIVVLPAIFYLVVSGVTITVASKLNIAGLKAYFGLFLVAAAVYFMFFAKKIKLKPTVPAAAVCSTISGVASGLFGIGGPPMVLYFLAATEDKKENYLGTTQAFFALTSIYNTTIRAINGIITVDLLPLVIPGILGIWLGKIFGQKIVDRINIEQLKKLIYAFLGVSGIVTFVTNI